MDFTEHKEELNKELERFIELLKITLPRYKALIKKKDISDLELKELGDIEYFLIEINGKIAELKKQLEYDLFGLSLDLYYKLKQKALSGDYRAARKTMIMRKAFDKALKGNDFINWN